MKTMVEVFCQQVNTLGGRPAMRYRRAAGGWEDISWCQYGSAVNEVAWGLLALGVQPGDRVGLLSSNRPEWLFADIGTLAAGAVTVPIYPTLIPSGVEHVVGHSEMVVV